MGQHARLLPHGWTVRLVLLVAAAFAQLAASADARALNAAPPLVILDEPSHGSVTSFPGFSGTAGTAAGDVLTVTVRVYAGASTAGTLVATLEADVDPDGGFWNGSPDDALADGTYTAQAAQVGVDGTGVSDANTFRVDTTPPAVTLVQPADGAETADRTPTFSGAAGNAIGDEDSVRVRVFGDSADEQFVATRVGTTWSVTPDDTQALAPGTYSVVADQSDDAFNVGESATHSLTISGPPEVSINTPSDGDTLEDSLPQFSGAAGGRDGDASTVTLELWQGADTSGAPFRTLTATREGAFWQVRPSTPLSNGLYSARARQASADGPGTSEVVSFTIAAPAELASAGPLTRIRTGPDLGCAVNHVEDSSGEFYGDFACGTLVVVDGVLFGPANIPAGGSAGPRTGFAPISQTVGGAGTAADPLAIVTVADAGTTGVRITQRDTYVIGEESYRTEVSLANTGGTLRTIKLYRAADCYLQDSDNGFGEVDPATGAVACKTPPDPITGNARIEQWFPLSPGSHYMEAGYSQVWARIGAQLDFDDTCLCDAHIDNGAGLSWAMTVAAGGTTSRAHLTTFSPLGRQPLTMSKTADAASTLTGGENGYTITIRNSGDLPVTLASVTDDLPAGFAYVPGTTTGATTANPSIAGRTLTWSDVAVPANGDVTMHFRVTVSDTPGEYRNEADAVATGPAVVVGTGPTAPVTVVADAPPVITLVMPAAGSSTTDATPTFSGVAGTAAGDAATVTVDVYAGPDATGLPVQSLTAARDATGAYSVDASTALAPGTYTARARQGDSGGNTGLSTANTFTVTAAGPRLRLEGYSSTRTDGDWGLTESLLSTTRGYVLDPANFGPAGIVDIAYEVGSGIDVASPASLAGVDVFFTGWVTSSSYTDEEKAALRSFVLGGGTVIATTDDVGHSMVDAFGLTQGDGSGSPTPNVITEPAHPIASGPFGAVTEYSQFALTGHYPSLGSHAHEVGRYAAGPGTTLAVIERGALGVGSGAVVFVADVDVFSNDGAGVNADLIKNIFAFVARESTRPALAIGDVTKAEGDAGTTTFELPVTLSSGGGPVNVHWATAPGTATEAEDFTAASGNLNFAAGETTKSVTVAVAGDTVPESDEDFVVNLSAASGARLVRPQATATIVNDDAAGSSLTVVTNVINDDGGTRTAAGFSVHVKSAGVDVLGSPQPGSAAGTTYALQDGVLHFVSEDDAPGYVRTFSGDCASEGSIVLGIDESKTCTITNNDVAVVPPGDCLEFADFSPPTGMQLLGSAGITGDALRLTPALGDQAGFAWYGARVPVSGSFTSDFRFSLTEAAGLGGGADGLTFAIQNAGVVATAALGGGLGYEGLPNSVVVEFDTYDNGAFYGDPNDNHVAVHTRGSEPNGPAEDSLLGAAPLTPVLKDGQIHQARVVYGGGELSVYVDDLATPALTVPIDLAQRLDLTEGRAFAGFTAATGSGVENHDVLDWSLCPDPTPPQTGTLTVVKHVVNDDGGTASASDFTMHVRSGGSDVAGRSPFPGAEAPGTTRTLDAGTYTVAESGGPAGYAATVSGDCAPGGTVTLAAGQSKTCTITNDDPEPAPVVALEQPADGAATNDATPAFAGTAQGGTGNVTVKVYEGGTTGGALVRTLTATVGAGGAWSVSPTSGLADGTYTAQAERGGAGGVGRSAPRTFRIDTTAPAPTLDDPPDGTDSTPTFTGTAGNATGDDPTVTVKVFDGSNALIRTLTATRAGTSFTVDASPPLEPGTYTARAEQDDDLGNGPGVSVTRTFTILRAAPAVTLTSPADGSRGNDSTPAFSGTASDRVGDSATVAVEVFAGTGTSGTPLRTLTATRSGTGWTVDLVAGLADGTYTARARQTQTLGPDGVSAARTFVVDTTAPAVTVTVPGEGASTTDTTPSFAGTAGNAPGDSTTVTIEVFAGSNASGTPVRTLQTTRSGALGGSWTGELAAPEALEPGTYTVRARQSDDVGNVAVSITRTFTILRAASTVTLTSPAAGRSSDPTPAFSGTAGDHVGDSATVTVEVFAGTGTLGSPVRELSVTRTGTAWTAVLATALADGTYTARARQTQTLGPDGVSAARTFVVDTTAPTVTVAVPGEGASTTDTTPSFAGAAGNAPGDSTTVTIEIFAGAGTSGLPVRSVGVTRSGSGWTLELAAADALALGTYTVRARQSDDVGNAAVSNTRTFTIARAAPAVTLTAPADGSRSNDSTPAFSGAASDRAGDSATVTVEVFAGTGTSGTPVRELSVPRTGTAWTAVLATALPDGTYTARARQTQTGGQAGTSAPRTFTVDTTAPAVTITTPANGATTALGGAVTFAGGAGAAVGDGSAIVLRVFSGAGTGGAVVQSLTATRVGATWSVGASPALAPGSYTVQAEQADSVGNVGRSGAHTFTVPAPVLDDVGEIDVPKGVKRSHLFCKRAHGCKGLVGSAEFRDRGKAVWKLTVTYRRNGRTKTATVAKLTQRVNVPGTKEFKLTAIGKQGLLNKLSGARNVKLTLTLTFTDRDGNRTVRTMPVKLKR